MIARPATETLRRTLRNAVHDARHAGRPVLASVVEEIEPFDALSAFGNAGTVADRFYWSPTVGPRLVGAGSAISLDGGYDHIEDAWSRLLDGAHVVETDAPATGPLLFGAYPFDPARAGRGRWDGIPVGKPYLPRLLLTAGEDRSWLTVNILVQPWDDEEALATGIDHDVVKLLRSRSVDSYPDQSARLEQDEQREWWQALVATAVDTIHRGGLTKVVLARAATVRLARPPEAALAQLSRRAGHATLFALGTQRATFIGATPEWLVRLHGGTARVSCLAGTTPRGRTPDEDDALGQRLLASAKDRHEHALVVRSVEDCLAGFCDELSVPAEPVLLKLPNLQHLSTPVRGTVRDASLLRIVRALHPTPAMAGVPTDAAMRFLRDHEELDRGAYAGPVGWMNRSGEGELAVGIRSALLKDGDATVFAGCGIVDGSDPEAEYRESSVKMGPMLAALGVTDDP